MSDVYLLACVLARLLVVNNNADKRHPVIMRLALWQRKWSVLQQANKRKPNNPNKQVCFSHLAPWLFWFMCRDFGPALPAGVQEHQNVFRRLREGRTSHCIRHMTQGLRMDM